MPLARPEPRGQERQAARRGELAEAPPVICEGTSLPMAGALLILPTLAATGLVTCAEEVYDKAKAAFYGLRSLVLAVVFAALVGEARARRRLRHPYLPKAAAGRRARRAFTEHTHSDEAGRTHRYLLADRRVRLAYKDGGARRLFACRQIARLDPDTGDQTHIVTTRGGAPAEVAHAMFSRWRQENFFRYLRAHYGLDALDSYATVPDDLARSVPNPAKKPVSSRAGEARRRLADIEQGLLT